MRQLRVSLFQRGIIETRSRSGVSTMLPFQARNVIGNFVINGTDPLRINAERGINQEGTKERTKETTEQTTNPGSLASVESP